MSSKRTVLVTGASRGIGLAVCRRLLAAGHRVIGVARSIEHQGAPLRGKDFIAWPLDLAERQTLPQRLTELARSHPDIDAVIGNAGGGRFGALEEFSYAQIDALISLNFTAQAFLARALLPAMKRRGRGDLVFIGSEAALAGGGRGAVYSASKAALRGFAQALRAECARSGVRVCVINPGPVRSSFFDRLDFAPGEADDNALEPDDVAAAVQQVLAQRPSVVLDEINLSPLKKVWRRQPPGGRR